MGRQYARVLLNGLVRTGHSGSRRTTFRARVIKLAFQKDRRHLDRRTPAGLVNPFSRFLRRFRYRGRTYWTVTVPFIVLWTLQENVYVPAAGKMRVWVPAVVNALEKPSAGTWRSWGTSALHVQVT